MSRKRKSDALPIQCTDSPQQKRHKANPTDDVFRVYTRISKGKGFDAKDWNEETQRWASFRANLPPEITYLIISFVGGRIQPISKYLTLRMMGSVAETFDASFTGYAHDPPRQKDVTSPSIWWKIVAACQAINTAFVLFTPRRDKTNDDGDVSALAARITANLLTRTSGMLTAMASMIPTTIFDSPRFFGKPPSSLHLSRTRLAKMRTIVNALLRWFGLSRMALKSGAEWTELRLAFEKTMDDWTLLNSIRFHLTGYFSFIDNGSAFCRVGQYGKKLPPTQKALALFEIMNIGDMEHAQQMRPFFTEEWSYDTALACHDRLFQDYIPDDVDLYPQSVHLMLNPIIFRALPTSAVTFSSQLRKACHIMESRRTHFDFRWQLEFAKIVASHDYEAFEIVADRLSAFLVSRVSHFRYREGPMLSHTAIFHYWPAVADKQDRTCISYTDDAYDFASMDDLEEFLVEFVNGVAQGNRQNFVNLVEMAILSVRNEKECAAKTIEEVFNKFKKDTEMLQERKKAQEEKRKEKLNANAVAQKILDSARFESKKLLEDARRILERAKELLVSATDGQEELARLEKEIADSSSLI